MSPDLKNSIRQKNLYIRDNMDFKEVNGLSQLAVQRLVKLGVFITAKQVLMYMPLGNEIDSYSLFERCLQEGKKVGIPKVLDKETMNFYILESTKETHIGRFGVTEPDSNEMLEINRPTIMVIPGLAFDEKKYRIGFGAGYYDHYLSSLKKEPKALLTTVGVFYDWQEVESISPHIKDVALDIIVTPTRTFS